MTRLDALRVPPGNQFKALKGAEAGSYQIRVNDQYRIRFTFRDEVFYDVCCKDYHSVLMPHDDRPLATRTAASPAVPPRRPNVGIAMADGGDFRARFQETDRRLAALDQCDALIVEIDARRRAGDV